GIRVGEDESGGEASLADRLSRKIRQQAVELADLTERLGQQCAYSRLVESRLLELDPNHPLPVVPQNLVGGQESLGARSCKQRVSAGTRTEDGGIDQYRQGYEVAHEKLRDAVRLIKQLREALEARDAQAKVAADQTRALHREVSVLQSRLDLKSTRSRCSGRTGGGEGSRLAREVLELRGELSALRQEVRNERDATDEARAEAETLRAALKSHSEELGLGPEGGSVPSELAEVRREISGLQKELSSRKSRALRAEEELKHSRAVCTRLQKELNALSGSAGPGA
ncbi:unnamed protein product, partial [Discosporangium mesarthrocarpum]